MLGLWEAIKTNGRKVLMCEEAINRIHNADARTVAEGYGSVCDTIAEGKDRFRKRCQEWDEYEDIRQ